MTQTAKEPTRVRQQGTRNTRTDGSGAAKIAAIRDIVARGQYAKIDGIMVDLFSASAIIAVYDAISTVHQMSYVTLSIPKMAAVAFKLLK